MAPSSTNGATIARCRKPATKVIVFQWPCGARGRREQWAFCRLLSYLVGSYIEALKSNICLSRSQIALIPTDRKLDFGVSADHGLASPIV